MQVKTKVKPKVLKKWGYISRRERCEQRFVVLSCKKCGFSYATLLHCGYRTCPVCAKRRASELFSEVSEIIESLPITRKRRLWHIVLTFGTEYNLRYRTVKVWKAFFKVWRNLLKTKDSGALVSLEVGGLNDSVHLHILYYGGKVSKRALRREWYKHTGKFQVHLGYIRRREKGIVREVVKYTLKGVGGEIDKLFLYEKALFETHRFSRFGIFRGVETRKFRVECPKCGSRKWEYCDTLRLEEDIWEVCNIVLGWFVEGGVSVRGSPLSVEDRSRLFCWLSLCPRDVVKVLKGDFSFLGKALDNRGYP